MRPGTSYNRCSTSYNAYANSAPSADGDAERALGELRPRHGQEQDLCDGASKGIRSQGIRSQNSLAERKGALGALGALGGSNEQPE